MDMRDRAMAGFALLGAVLFVAGLSDLSFIGAVLVAIAYGMHVTPRSEAEMPITTRDTDHEER